MRPTRRAVRLTGLVALGGFCAALWGGRGGVVVAAGLLLAVLVALGIDLARGAISTVPRAAREIPGSLPHGVWSPVRLTVTNESARPVSLVVHDHHPAALLAEQLPAAVSLAADAAVSVVYRLMPSVRGEHHFGPIDLLIEAPWRLWRRRCLVVAPCTVRVFPNFAAVSQYRLLAAANRAGQLGVRRRRRRGEGLELHQLREYRSGDPVRLIDWKATARRGTLISREYEVERDQTILFLLDCGRRMRAAEHSGTHLDHALNAVLLLAYVALRQGDSVGLLTFGADERWLSPVKGRLAMKSILRAVYDLDASTRAPDYAAAAGRLTRLHARRSLVITITNLRDEDQSELIPALELLRRRHLLVLASLRERALDAGLAEPPARFEDALRIGALHQYLGHRQALHELLARRGLEPLDVLPEQLPVRLVNRYLEIKSAGLL